MATKQRALHRAQINVRANDHSLHAEDGWITTIQPTDWHRSINIHLRKNALGYWIASEITTGSALTNRWGGKTRESAIEYAHELLSRVGESTFRERVNDYVQTHGDANRV